jgi:hypothetical protein
MGLVRLDDKRHFVGEAPTLRMFIPERFDRWPWFGFRMGKSKFFEEPALTDFSRVFEAAVIIRKQEGRGLFAGLVQFQRTENRSEKRGSCHMCHRVKMHSERITIKLPYIWETPCSLSILRSRLLRRTGCRDLQYVPLSLQSPAHQLQNLTALLLKSSSE